MGTPATNFQSRQPISLLYTQDDGLEVSELSTISRDNKSWVPGTGVHPGSAGVMRHLERETGGAKQTQSKERQTETRGMRAAPPSGCDASSSTALTWPKSMPLRSPF